MRDRRAHNAEDRYHYSHNESDGVTGQDYLGVAKTYSQPTDHGYEAELAERLREIKALRSSKQDRQP